MNLELYGIYKMNNGQFVKVYITKNENLVDSNGIGIEKKELEDYKKIL